LYYFHLRALETTQFCVTSAA